MPTLAKFGDNLMSNSDWQVGCLNLVTNAIIIWNTVYIERVMQQLQQEGCILNNEDLMHIWPTRHAHIIEFLEEIAIASVQD